MISRGTGGGKVATSTNTTAPIPVGPFSLPHTSPTLVSFPQSAIMNETSGHEGAYVSFPSSSLAGGVVDGDDDECTSHSVHSVACHPHNFMMMDADRIS